MAPPDAPVLTFDRVSAAYGPYRALFNVSFTVAPGSIVALLGSNGAGKSTIARVASGLVPSSEGHVLVAGQELTHRPAYRFARAGVAHVPEGRGVFSNLTVEENLRLAFRRRLGRAQVSDALSRAYEAFPILGSRRKQQAGTLSGGQQRLLSLAKVLIAPCKLLIADELSLGLAPLVVDDVYRWLSEIHQAGTSLLIVEQQIDRALTLADHAIVIERGEVAYDGAPEGAAGAVEAVLAARGHETLAVGSDETPSPGARQLEGEEST
jgi:branched-chain amino acid transport system ATP-binding protein